MIKWKNIEPDRIFGGQLQEDTLQEEKDINGSILKVNIFLAVTATLLSLIGMYNLVSLDIIKRTKEIGIRYHYVHHKQKIYYYPFYSLNPWLCRRILYVAETPRQYMGLFCKDKCRHASVCDIDYVPCYYPDNYLKGF